MSELAQRQIADPSYAQLGRNKNAITTRLEQNRRLARLVSFTTACNPSPGSSSHVQLRLRPEANAAYFPDA